MTEQNQHKPNDPSFLTNTSNEHLPWWERLAAEDHFGQFKQNASNVWRTNKSMTILAMLVILGVAVAGGLLVNNQSLDDRSQASVSNGPAIIMLAPTGGTSFKVGTKQSIDVLATTGSRPVVGVQMVMTFSGNIPSDLTFVPATLPDFQVIRNSYSKGRLEFMSLIPPKETGMMPFSTQAPVKIGTLQFTTPSKKGSMTVSFSATETLIADFETNQDISRAPSATKYSFVR